MSVNHKIEPGTKVDLRKIDPESQGGLLKTDAAMHSARLGQRLAYLADLLYFAGQHSVLIVLQGMDTSGKDGTIRCLLQSVNTQGAHVHPFKVPSHVEIAHDFLWRCHQKTPGKGEMSIFNRSYYEDVLVVRVHGLVPETKWSQRYEHINHFEKLLTDNETIVLKFFLHISLDEQEQRLLERENEVEKSWKLSVGDWKERVLWDDYQKAYEVAIEKCSTESAPWQIIPANKKWYRNLAIMQAIVDALEPYEKGWLTKLEEIGVKAKAELAVFKALPK